MTPARSILRGDLDKIGLPTLLTILDMEKRGGILILQRGKQLGRLFLRDGRVIRAQIEGQQRQSGVDAVMRLLAWNTGVFELWQADVIGPDEIQRHTTFLLMEAARRLDEAQSQRRTDDDADERSGYGGHGAFAGPL
ncbi:MAG: DUF4388 domain-containing protein [Deltaproteobacteria bacterium]|nr:DUF4388 domain-containing protein [Deltaproteobacteria bacterium]